LDTSSYDSEVYLATEKFGCFIMRTTRLRTMWYKTFSTRIWRFRKENISVREWQIWKKCHSL